MSKKKIKIFFIVNIVTTYSSVSFNPLTPTSDQDRISPYNINTISGRQVMRININQGLLVDPIPNSPN